MFLSLRHWILVLGILISFNGFEVWAQGDSGNQDNTPPTPEELDPEDGVASIADRATFKKLSYKGPMRMDAYLSDLEFVKFILTEAGTKNQKLYIMNTRTHQAHPRFMGHIGLRGRGGGRGGPGGRGGFGPPGTVRGAITFFPLVRAPNNEPGLYVYDFQPNDAHPVETLKVVQDILIKKIPILKGKIAYHPLSRSMSRVEKDKAAFKKAGISVYTDKEIYSDIAYLPLNPTTSFGRLRIMKLGEIPQARDIVLYKSLPNELPRVAGIITEVRQTPLSHVNLRAIQDKVPNAYIREAQKNKSIQKLIGKLVHYKVTQDGFQIREATEKEVETHFSKLRPAKPQVPPRNLEEKAIKKLDEISFQDSKTFGVKASNLAAMRKFKYPEGMIPDGYAVPFYFYDSFMKQNGLYKKAQQIISNPKFKQNEQSQLTLLRNLIKQAPVPMWMDEALEKLRKSFPEGTSLRCRSSTNNEDLPGFSGAGLYGSFTHQADEGYLSKSVKQVFASLWNYRAFQEREFYRIDHFKTAMGVLIHPNFSNEKANGVAVTEDVLYQTFGNYYLNTQVAEDLVTNPNQLSVPDEILLAWWAEDGHEVRQYSNRKEQGKLILTKDQLNQLRKALTKTHSRFAKLYKVDPEKPGFAMEVEFKITHEGKLIIKQARPWVFSK